MAQKKIGEISFKDIKLPTQFPFILGLPQADTERLLTEHLLSQGGHIERGATLVNFTHNDVNVTAEIQHADGRNEKISCEWLIAADGAHSTVRKKLNLPFSGGTIQEKFIMADVIMKTDFNPDYVHAFSSCYGPLVFAPMPNFTRLICTVTNDPGIKDFAHPTLDDFEYAIANRSPAKVTIDSVVWISHFLTHHRIINNYRHGRILFAGDSAHIHSPVGGQGMNTGMQDTFNLAWKLASVIQQKSNHHLLDSYNTERHAVAKKVLDGTTKMTKIVALKNSWLVALRNRILKFLLKYSFVQQKILMSISELAIGYAPSEIILSGGQRAPFPELFSGTHHTLLLFAGEKPADTNTNLILQLAKSVLNIPSGFFDVIIVGGDKKYFSEFTTQIDNEFTIHDSYGLRAGGMCIVRPDLYIGLCQPKISYSSIKKYVDRIRA